MTREEAIEQLKHLRDGNDTEADHAKADDILCDLLATLGYADVVAEYVKVNKWFA